MTRIGTNCFISINAANRYYAEYGLTPADVREKLRTKEIRIGRPKVANGEQVDVNAEGRFVVTQGEEK